MKRIVYCLVLAMILGGCGIQPINKDEVNPIQDETTIEEANNEAEPIEVAPVEPPVIQAQPLIKVTGDILNVRNNPTVVDSTKLGVVLEDSVFIVLDEAKDEEDQTWYQIEYDDGLKGWIAGWFTEKYDNPNNYTLTSEQWKDYNAIQKDVTQNGWYKSPLNKKLLYRSLVYDFDLDGEVDSVYVDLKLGELEIGEQAIKQGIITYNDQKLVFDYVPNGEYGWGLTEFGVMDVNKKDQSVEFYIKEGDLPDRVLYTIYRIEAGRLTQVTSMSGEILGVYGDGKIYYWGGHLIEPTSTEEHNPDMATSYYDIEQGTYVTTDQIIGKTVPVSWKVILYKNKEDVIDGGPMEFDQMLAASEDTRVAILEAGVKMTVLEHDHQFARTKVKTDNGYEGWVGGFHMVWD